MQLAGSSLDVGCQADYLLQVSCGSSTPHPFDGSLMPVRLPQPLLQTGSSQTVAFTQPTCLGL